MELEVEPPRHVVRETVGYDDDLSDLSSLGLETT
jgi:hypothetical protein